MSDAERKALNQLKHAEKNLHAAGRPKAAGLVNAIRFGLLLDRGEFRETVTRAAERFAATIGETP